MKRSDTSFLLIAIGVLAFSCQKPDDLPGKEDLSVYATTINNVDGAGTEEPLIGKEVFVAAKDDATGFLFSGRTDAQGYFLFKGLISGTSYRVFAQDVVGANGLVVAADTVVDGSAGTLHLQLVPGHNNQNGFVLTFIDGSDNVVAGLPVRVYTTQALAQQDPGTGSLLSTSTDAFGRVSKLGIAAGDYYARVKTVAPSVDTLVQVTVAADGIADPTFTVHPHPILLTGMRVWCTDSNDSGVPGLSVMGFVNQTLANLADSATASFFCTHTGQGYYAALGMPPAIYYVAIRNAAIPVNTVEMVPVLAQQVDTVHVIVMP